MMGNIDIVVPCYNEQEVLQTFYDETVKVIQRIKGYEFQFLFVDDGSRDDTLLVMEQLAEKYQGVKYVSFSRNFGKEAAIYAGLKYSSGEYVILMDADLQHPPSMIPDMLAGIEEGYDCCAARRVSRDGESRIRSAFSRMFYKLSNCMTEIQIPENAVDFRMMSRKMVDSVLEISEVERFSKGIFSWVGFQTKWLPYENVERTLGTTKWNFGKLLKYALGGITSFSVMPLRIVSCMGFAIFFMACFYIVLTLARTLVFGIEVPGYVTTLCAVLFLGGLLELSLGVVGEYIAHIYMEAKDRPVFIVGRSNFHTENNCEGVGGGVIMKRQIKKTYVLAALAIIQMVFIFTVNLTKFREFLDYDSSLTIRHGMEMWKHGLFLKDWVYFSTLETDCAGFFAAGLYMLTGNLNLSGAVAHLFSYAAMVFVIHDLFLHLGEEKTAEKTLTAVLLLYTPYSFGQLEWSNMMFVSIGAYEYRVLLMLLLVDLFVICERHLCAGRKFYILCLCAAALDFWVSLSMGNYVLFMILAPIALKMVCDVIRKEEFFLRAKENWLMLCMACISAAGWMLRNHYVGASHRNNLTLIVFSKFFTNLQNCIAGIFSLFGGLTGNEQLQLFSAEGIMVLMRFFFLLFCLLYLGYQVFHKNTKNDACRLRDYLLCYMFVHILLLSVTNTSYGMIFEYRYHILWSSLLLVFTASCAFEAGQYQNRWLYHCISGGVMAVLAAVHLWGAKVCFLDLIENQFIKTMIQVMSESGADAVYFCNMPSYSHRMRVEMPAVYCVNVEMGDEGNPKISALGDFYTYYADRAQAGEENILVCTSAEFEKMPGYIQKAYTVYTRIEGDYYAYASSENYWDGCTGLPSASTDISVDIPFNSGYSYTGEISDTGTLVSGEDEEGYILGSPSLHAAAGTYEVRLDYHMPAAGWGDSFFEIAAVQGETVLAKQLLSGESGELTLPDVQLSDGQEVVVRLWKGKDAVVEVEKIVYRRV